MQEMHAGYAKNLFLRYINLGWYAQCMIRNGHASQGKGVKIATLVEKREYLLWLGVRDPKEAATNSQKRKKMSSARDSKEDD